MVFPSKPLLCATIWLAVVPKVALSFSSEGREYRQGTALSGWLQNLFPAALQETDDVDKDRQRDFPEQYPATNEINHSIVSGDTGDAQLVRPLLKNTQLESKPLRVVYDANSNGWNYKSFHNAVDGKGAAIIIARGHGTDWFGGYNPKGWAGTGGARPSIAAFLWYTRSDGVPQKLQKVGGGGLACAKDDPDTGIWLGADGLVIPLASGDPKEAQSKLGTYFEKRSDGKQSLFDAGCIKLADLKVLVGEYEDNEAIPYSGAVFDMTSG